ncbi:uncharacterized protein ACHE_50050A [Aspergillus chevalieri]|uniref:Uncharacterized protein n=1 Tax=Aspergillus chevalieri TaxID=182096 RepID=A0A7R7VQI8_ASPCH|nr:uncharacterized protein ACHE_50050A [Aspergillus chevalieri]BCR88852.1 hypothetical protein ACHE_50050A [Aspergillus chevalieri]
MPTRTIFLLSSRNAPFQRMHFAIFIPSPTSPNAGRGTLINVVGAPMAGYKLEFERNHVPASRQHYQHYELFPIGEVNVQHIVDSEDEVHSVDDSPRGEIEIVATQVKQPGISENFLAPVNDTTNRRCQEWTMDYVRHLVKKGIIGEEAVEIVQGRRDPPEHGIGLKAGQR